MSTESLGWLYTVTYQVGDESGRVTVNAADTDEAIVKAKRRVYRGGSISPMRYESFRVVSQR